VAYEKNYLHNKEKIRQWIVERRAQYNRNNCTRTDFYLNYWEEYREVPWTLIAHIVSRNTGYQMSDLARLRRFSGHKSVTGKLLTYSIGSTTIDSMFAFLEAGNYLILHDVFPQLAAFAWAKQILTSTGKDYSDSIFSILEEDFGVDPFIAEEWKRFFAEAKIAAWWADDPEVAIKSPVARQTLALVANEQNYIEKRLVNPGKHSTDYLDKREHAAVHKFIRRINMLHYPRLVTVEADPRDLRKPGNYLVCRIHDFIKLDSRIKIGRQLYNCIFRQGVNRSSLVQAWAAAETNRVHHGSRMDYDDICYKMEQDTGRSSGQAYSPPLVHYRDHLPAWPIDPGSDKRFRQTHFEPAKLQSWSEPLSEKKIESWLEWDIKYAAKISEYGTGRSPVEILL
jgi:hypothetical protein